MKDSQGARWLLEQLPRLTASGVLPETSAAALRAHYEPQAAGSIRVSAVVIFSVLGGLLISDGIILLFAHNWDELGRPARTVLSFFPLLLGLGLSATALRRRGIDGAPLSTAWAEGAGAFHALAIGAAIALIGQTYQIPGDLSAFLLSWILLALPLVYGLGSVSVALIYLAGITSWAGFQVNEQDSMLGFWALLAAVLPFVVAHGRENRFSGRAWWLALGLALSVSVATGLQCDRAFFYTWQLLFAGLFAVFYLVGRGWFRRATTPALEHPFIVCGQLGVATLTILLTFRDGWRDPGFSRSAIDGHTWLLAELLGYSAGAAALILYAVNWRRGVAMNPLAGLLPAVVLLAAFLRLQQPGITLLLMNFYALGLGVVTVMRGLRDLRLASLNAGLLLLAVLILARFFDSDLGFIVKGVGFIVVGAGFCAANVFLLKKRKGVA